MLESLFPFEFVEKKYRYAVMLGVCYSIIALGISVIIFPSDPSLISLAIITLLLYPTLQKVLAEHEKIEASRYHTGLFSFFKEHKRVLIMYLLITISIFFVFFTFSMLNPSSTSVLFTQQQQALSPYIGQAMQAPMYSPIYYIFNYVQHNMQVLVLMFIAAFILGEGGILLLSWNASSWGVFFGVVYAQTFDSFSQLITGLLIVLPHIILEISAYIIIVIAASILSKAFFSVHIPKTKRNNVVNDTAKACVLAVMVLVIAAVVETYAFTLLQTIL